MNMDNGDASALSPYRVLDLTDGALSLCGKLLADLGADVIKVEKPGGDTSRTIGPFYKDIPHPERSLFWWAYNVNKKGITLDLATSDGRDIFRKLVRTSDFVIESFAPGYLHELGLGFDALASIKPSIILSSITPYGQTGPKAGNPWCDLTAWASGGAAYITGDVDRPPVCMGFIPLISAQAASELLTATLIAHYEREVSNKGQHVELSIQESCIGILQAAVESWDLARIEYKRSGGSWATSGAARRLAFKCKDGFAILLQGGGGSVRMVKASESLVEWMSETDMASDWLKRFDWANDYIADKLTQETIDKIEGEIERFLLHQTKKAIYREGWQRGLMIAPVHNMEDIAADEQLIARGFWEKIEHPELDAVVTYCGPFARMSGTPLTCRRRPPLIGEHNLDIYAGEMNIPMESLTALKSAGAI